MDFHLTSSPHRLSEFKTQLIKRCFDIYEERLKSEVQDFCQKNNLTMDDLLLEEHVPAYTARNPFRRRFNIAAKDKPEIVPSLIQIDIDVNYKG